MVSIKLATKQKAEEVLMKKRQEIYLGWVSLIAGLEYGMERWNGKWNGTVNVHNYS